jgi:hypothetical protein
MMRSILCKVFSYMRQYRFIDLALWIRVPRDMAEGLVEVERRRCAPQHSLAHTGTKDEVVEIRDIVDARFPLGNIFGQAFRWHWFPVPLEVGRIEQVADCEPRKLQVVFHRDPDDRHDSSMIQNRLMNKKPFPDFPPCTGSQSRWHNASISFFGSFIASHAFEHVPDCI